MAEYAIGIDLGGTTVKYAVVSSLGDILFSGVHDTNAEQGGEAILSQLLKGVNLCQDYAKQKGLSLKGIGIGTPGIVAEDLRSVVGGAENLPGWEHLPVAERVEQAGGLKVLMGNDANMMAYAEALFGAAKGATDVLFVTVGTGIGCGLLLDGKLYRGYKGRGMEMGHITVKSDGEMCACGRRGCLEHYASTAALVRRYEELASDGVSMNGREIVARYHAREPLALQVMDEHWDYLAHGIASMINLLSPQMIVVGGGISEAGEFYIEALGERVLKYAIPECASGVRIVRATLGNCAGELGAAGLFLNQ